MNNKIVEQIKVIDLFSGVAELTCELEKTWLSVIAGLDFNKML